VCNGCAVGQQSCWDQHQPDRRSSNGRPTPTVRCRGKGSPPSSSSSLDDGTQPVDEVVVVVLFILTSAILWNLVQAVCPIVRLKLNERTCRHRPSRIHGRAWRHLWWHGNKKVLLRFHDKCYWWAHSPGFRSKPIRDHRSAVATYSSSVTVVLVSGAKPTTMLSDPNLACGVNPQPCTWVAESPCTCDATDEVQGELNASTQMHGDPMQVRQFHTARQNRHMQRQGQDAQQQCHPAWQLWQLWHSD